MVTVGRMVPGISDELLEREHVARYQFASSLADGCSVLDVACGMGYAAPMFIRAGARSYLGVDLDADSVNSAMEKYRINDEVCFVVDDACELRKVADGLFDLVVSFETIVHLPRPEVFLVNVRRVLRGGDVRGLDAQPTEVFARKQALVEAMESLPHKGVER
jgi:ubiquinone/menaquinone biosynthesis C-methylase UbiE